MSEEEITEKLAHLKQYSRDFDTYEAKWKATGGEREAYNAMMLAERNYVGLLDWLWANGIDARWDRKRGEYVVRVPISVP